MAASSCIKAFSCLRKAFFLFRNYFYVIALHLCSIKINYAGEIIDIGAIYC